MGLGVALSNALSGMSTSQASLEVLSRNVSNSGTPGYHVQSLNVIDTQGANSIFARTGAVQRAFDASLQATYNTTVSTSAYTAARTDALDQLQTFMGTPGGAGSLDTMFGNYQNALQSLSTSPDNYSARQSVLSQAQALASTLNTLSSNIQGLRQNAETQISASVGALNDAVSSLQSVNQQLSDQSADPTTRAALEDQRDRLVSQIAEQIDVRADYRPDGTVALMTKNGVGILDGQASTFDFQPAGTITANKQQGDGGQDNVGQLTLSTPAGLKIDLVATNVLQSGKLAALVNLRDKTLVTAQNQLDQIAAGLAESSSTVTTQGTAATSGAQAGYSLDLSTIRDGNDFTLDYTQGGQDKTVKVVSVTDPSKLPLDYTDASGTRVIGANFSAGAANIASQLRNALGPGLTISGSGTTLTVLDDGAAGTTDINSLVSHATVTGTQTGQAALSLFTDSDGSDYTGSLTGDGQLRGFASRITVNPAVLSDNTLLSQYQTGVALGDPTRANYMLNQLQSMTFAAPGTSTPDMSSFRLSGTVSDLISQTMDYTGSIAADAESADQTQQTAMDSVNQRMDSSYGVNVDQEMAQLIQLQNAYAANSRIISVVQDLMNKLLQS